MDWIEFLHTADVLKIGSFRLKSGKESPYFLNFGSVDSGICLRQMGEHFARAILAWDLRPDLLFGPAYKGLPLAIATAMEYTRLSGQDLAYSSFRKEAKQHGDAGPVLGRPPRAEDRIVMIDDVLTTSATKIDSLAEIERFVGGKPNVVAVVVGVDRLERSADGVLFSLEFEQRTGIPLKALTTSRALVDALRQQGKIDEAAYQSCLDAL